MNEQLVIEMPQIESFKLTESLLKETMLPLVLSNAGDDGTEMAEGVGE